MYLVRENHGTAVDELGEQHNLIPWNQFGDRRGRSTETAAHLLQQNIRTVWAADRSLIVSVLSPDISGAFDHVSHARLLHILRRKAATETCVAFVRAFLIRRETKIQYTGHTSDWLNATTGI